jgi:hypothetical protein
MYYIGMKDFVKMAPDLSDQRLSFRIRHPRMYAAQRHAELVARYFAKLFERIAVYPIGGGHHSLSGVDLFHGHFFRNNGGGYIIFHAKEYPSDLLGENRFQGMGVGVGKGDFSTSDGVFRYRNVLWRGATCDIWALDADGSIDDHKHLPTGSEVFRNLIAPYAYQQFREQVAVDGQGANQSYFDEAVKAKTAAEEILGEPQGMLYYRCEVSLEASQRIVFERDGKHGANISWNENAPVFSQAAPSLADIAQQYN